MDKEFYWRDMATISHNMQFKKKLIMMSYSLRFGYKKSKDTFME